MESFIKATPRPDKLVDDVKIPISRERIKMRELLCSLHVSFKYNYIEPDC